MLELLFADFKMFWCLLFHKLRVLKEFEVGSRCVICNKGHIYAMNDSCRAFLRWDNDFKELYGYDAIKVSESKEQV